MKPSSRFLAALTGALLCASCAVPGPAAAHQPAPDPRLDWWREARFGLFVHWGLYAIPAGRWGDETGHGEWIRTTAQIPVGEYDRLLDRFDPQAFDADEWARLAEEAGMEYVVITSKHHDGFALFDSAVSDFDVMATPWQQDIMKEIARAFSARGLRPCWYHSIMDWHHPDYLPRRGWEAAGRPADGADMERFVEYLHAQVTELLTNYGPIGVMWFDGEWENTWNHERGQALYDLCRRLQPDVIVNNRVDVGRGGMAGLTEGPGYAGDFGTPEQEVPATGLPGVDWESCITMNAHWGWNEADPAWKSTTELVRLLVDVVSKGGNLLLNVGPRADGSFPPQAVERLRGIGRWMDLHGEAIHGTEASPFLSLPWGRCTLRRDDAGTRLFLHVFDWPADGRLVVPGIVNDSFLASLLADGRPLSIERAGPDLWIWLPERPTDPDCPVVELRVAGEPIVYRTPEIHAAGDAFVDAIEVEIPPPGAGLVARFRLDGAEPGPDDPVAGGPIRLREDATVAARAFHGTRPASATVRRTFHRETPLPALAADAASRLRPGVRRETFRGDWDRLPGWTSAAAVERRLADEVGLAERAGEERLGLRFDGWVRVPRAGMWEFTLESDDGARLRIADRDVVDLDGLHGPTARAGAIALAAGWHPLRVEWFNKTGGAVLSVERALAGAPGEPIPARDLAHLPEELDLPPPPVVEPGVGPLPTAQQLRWHDLQYYAFVHFGMNTFTDREWGEGREDPGLFAPSALDCRQWARVAKEAGMRGIILTVKHHDGFCLWDSAWTDHDVGASAWRGGRGDVLRELSDACREAGLAFGVYLSPWDRNHQLYGTPEYNDFFAAQLEEVLSSYGPLFEVWFDGANGEGPDGRRQVYDWDRFLGLVARLQPEALVFSDVGPGCRWVGNEAGFAGETLWGTISPAGFAPGAGAPGRTVLNEGLEGGTHWIPAECDVSIRPGWYYHPDQDSRVKSVAALEEIWYGSVGRGANLLLNLPVDRRGLVHETDAARLRELRARLDATFGVDLASGAAQQAGECRFAAPVEFDRVVLREDLRHGQRVRAFVLEASDDGAAWRPLVQATTIGPRRILRMEPTRAAALRVRVLDARAEPVLLPLAIHRSPDPATAAR